GVPVLHLLGQGRNFVIYGPRVGGMTGPSPTGEPKMSEISAAAVKALRDRTNAPMMLCKSALTEANGDMEKAIEIIRKKSKDVQVQKADRETAEGRVAVFIDPSKQVGAILEMRCESAPVVKNEEFVKLANDLAKHVALRNPATIDELLAQPIGVDSKKTV